MYLANPGSLLDESAGLMNREFRELGATLNEPEKLNLYPWYSQLVKSYLACEATQHEHAFGQSHSTEKRSLKNKEARLLTRRITDSPESQPVSRNNGEIN